MHASTAPAGAASKTVSVRAKRSGGMRAENVVRRRCGIDADGELRAPTQSCEYDVGRRMMSEMAETLSRY